MKPTAEMTFDNAFTRTTALLEVLRQTVAIYAATAATKGPDYGHAGSLNYVEEQVAQAIAHLDRGMTESAIKAMPTTAIVRWSQQGA